MRLLSLSVFCICAFVAYCSQANANEEAHLIFNNSSAEVTGTLAKHQRLKLRNVKVIDALDDADAGLFEQPTCFKSLKSVLLKSKHISEQLVLLEANYTGITELAIDSIAPLDEETLKGISKFTELKLFQLKSPGVSPKLLSFLPTQRMQILILDDMNLTERSELIFPELRQLRLLRCTLSASLFEELNAPLQKVFFSDSTLEKGVFAAPGKVDSLQQIFLYKCKFDPDDLRTLQESRPKIKVIRANSQNYWRICH